MASNCYRKGRKENLGRRQEVGMPLRDRGLPLCAKKNGKKGRDRRRKKRRARKIQASLQRGKEYCMERKGDAVVTPLLPFGRNKNKSEAEGGTRLFVGVGLEKRRNRSTHYREVQRRRGINFYGRNRRKKETGKVIKAQLQGKRGISN